jgi:hypothetical protein
MKEIISILFGLRSSRYFCIKDMFGRTFEGGGGGNEVKCLPWEVGVKDFLRGGNGGLPPLTSRLANTLEHITLKDILHL